MIDADRTLDGHYTPAAACDRCDRTLTSADQYLRREDALKAAQRWLDRETERHAHLDGVEADPFAGLV